MSYFMTTLESVVNAREKAFDLKASLEAGSDETETFAILDNRLVPALGESNCIICNANNVFNFINVCNFFVKVHHHMMFGDHLPSYFGKFVVHVGERAPALSPDVSCKTNVINAKMYV